MSRADTHTTQEALHRLCALLQSPGASADELQVVLGGLDRAAINTVVDDAASDTLLHIAARGGDVIVVQLMLTAGADPLARNAKGRSPGRQLGIDEDVRSELEAAAILERARKDAARAAVWNEALKRTQIESAFVLQIL